MTQFARIPPRVIALFGIAFICFLVVGTGVLAQQRDEWLQPITHFGGDTLYGVDAGFSVHPSQKPGSIRLQPAWLASPAPRCAPNASPGQQLRCNQCLDGRNSSNPVCWSLLH
jgi:hypothetical protein